MKLQNEGLMLKKTLKLGNGNELNRPAMAVLEWENFNTRRNLFAL